MIHKKINVPEDKEARPQWQMEAIWENWDSDAVNLLSTAFSILSQEETGSTYIIFVIVLIVGKFNHTIGALQHKERLINYFFFIIVDYPHHNTSATYWQAFTFLNQKTTFLSMTPIIGTVI